MDPVYGYQAVNVEAQQRHSTSLLHWMRNAISIRKKNPVFGRGSIEFVKPENRTIFAFIRRYQDDIVLCVFNLSRFAQPTELDLSTYEGRVPVEISGGVRFPRISQRPYQLSLNGYGFFWFALQPENQSTP